MYAKRQTESPTDHFFEVRLTPAQRERLLELCEGKTVSVARRNVLAQVLRAAERFDGRPYNWAEAERKAAERGESLADWIYDAESRRAA